VRVVALFGGGALLDHDGRQPEATARNIYINFATDGGAVNVLQQLKMKALAIDLTQRVDHHWRVCDETHLGDRPVLPLDPA
jgi:hypothetical protein